VALSVASKKQAKHTNKNTKIQKSNATHARTVNLAFDVVVTDGFGLRAPGGVGVVGLEDHRVRELAVHASVEHQLHLLHRRSHCQLQ
jgi:hypothetical protein